MNKENPNGSWHIDRRISLDHLLTPLLWVGTAAYIIAGAQARIVNLEGAQARNDQFIQNVRTTNETVTDRLARVETELSNMKAVLTRIDRKLDSDKP